MSKYGFSASQYRKADQARTTNKISITVMEYDEQGVALDQAIITGTNETVNAIFTKWESELKSGHYLVQVDEGQDL